MDQDDLPPALAARSRPAPPHRGPAPPDPALHRPAPLSPGPHPFPGPTPGAHLSRAPASVFAGHPASRGLRAPPPPSATALAFPAPQASLGSGRLAARLSGRGWNGRPNQWGAAAAAVAVAVAAVWDPDGLRWRQREAEGGGVGGSGGGRKVAAPVLLRVSVRRWERVTDMQCASPPGSCSPSAPTMWSWRRSGTTGPLRPGTVDEVLRCACLQVDIIPLITKADTISKHDLQMFKSKIMSELISSGIQIYQLPTDEETAAQANSSINMLLPFAVVGSMGEVKVAERMVRGHHYPWGVLQVFPICFFVPGIWSHAVSDICLGDGGSLTSHGGGKSFER
ncbi:SH3 and multiple ankyrin repeat domains protein 1-like [Macaca thibetana thibetana]|uniref:SH3 and multiple ankyrin repeat domains protein 1-like n=1 Tax=Macaca thibetana thibetana TaxID=257877 RepID=UPI0021BC97F8|nr:SH3 and multiple ankyrin repeat domains protein 1-like [Macaca thibetana thibetana]